MICILKKKNDLSKKINQNKDCGFRSFGLLFDLPETIGLPGSRRSAAVEEGCITFIDQDYLGDLSQALLYFLSQFNGRGIYVKQRSFVMFYSFLCWFVVICYD